ncbi:MAG: hypothetical protein WCS15_01470 [Prevotella sp.]|nr:hypothetical protein [Prevotella sp.]
MKAKKNITLKTLTKSSVWDIQENDVFRLWEAAEKDADLKDNIRRYIEIIRSAFQLEEVKVNKPEVISKYEARGFKIGEVRMGDGDKQKVAIKKIPILRVTDLSYENIRHISASKLIEVLDRNFGGGWESLSQATRDIIETGFDISTTTLPKDRLHKPGGLYEAKLQDGCEVLEISKGTWVEAIFAKEKPEIELPKPKFANFRDLDEGDEELDEVEIVDSEEDDLIEEVDKQEDDDEVFDEDKLTEESYRTTYEENPEDLEFEAEEISDEVVF